ncbi:MAG TPA: HisA/HisF-related TIM barrel protein [Gemmataceae bacterium]|jgi:phosphoribosylformimino-5-aminoimidazole carboxamide ribotide isomerase
MRILPVLDVMNGEVVRGVGGRRQEYRPIVSRLTTSSRPLDVARAIRCHFGWSEFYLADLDAILGDEPAWTIYAALREEGFRLWVDGGVRGMTQACQLADVGIESLVVGLETVAGPAELAAMVRAFGEHLVFSLDLRQGEPLGERDAWESEDARSIAAQAVRLGVRRLLVLDLARVGLGGGTGTRELCVRLCAEFPEVEVSAGGGVRNRGDLEELRDGGVRMALVASALHDGRLTRADLDGL